MPSWSDTFKTVVLPLKPALKMKLELDQFFTSKGCQVTVCGIDPAYSETLGIKEGDIISSINSSKPKSAAHAYSLLDREPEGGEHKCRIKRYGLERWGKPLAIVAGMALVTVCLVLYELELTGDDPREL